VSQTLEQHERKLHDPALCEQLPVRDYLDNIMVRTNGAFVAGYELKGLASYFASDEGRDRGKLMLEALLRSLPEQSMRVQFRYELVEDLGELLERYAEAQQSERVEVIALDDLRIERWQMKEANGHYMRPLLHVYFIWDPVVHRRIAGKPLKPTGNVFSVSARKCVERSRREHDQLLAEFESLLRGLETTLEAADLGARRLNDDDLFLEAKRALNPLFPDQRPYRRGEARLEYRSAREQIVDTSIADETDSYLNVGGILYSFVSLKELPEAQSFKRACSCFGLGRYLYHFTGTWVDLDDRKRPKTIPKLPDWATPEGWRRGLRPNAEVTARLSEQTPAGNNGNGDGHDNSRGASDQSASLVREIEKMEQALGKRMYRGLLKTLARVWNPKDIQDPAIQQKVLAHMQAAERGFRRLDAALKRVGPEPLTQILHSLRLQSIDRMDNLQTLHQIVLALEAAVQENGLKQ
jgi:hypothetical protein